MWTDLDEGGVAMAEQSSGGALELDRLTQIAVPVLAVQLRGVKDVPCDRGVERDLTPAGGDPLARFQQLIADRLHLRGMRRVAHWEHARPCTHRLALSPQALQPLHLSGDNGGCGPVNRGNRHRPILTPSQHRGQIPRAKRDGHHPAPPLDSRALAAIEGRGGMMSVALGAGDLTAMLAGCEDGPVSVAAVNGPAATVVAAEVERLERLRGECEAVGARARVLPVSYAAHSPQVESIRDELLKACEGIAACRSEIPFYSAVAGNVLDTAQLDGEYWYRNLREPVEFERTTRALLSHGHSAFIEVSPHPVLIPALQETAELVHGRRPPAADGTQRRGEPVDRAPLEPSSALVAGSLRRGEGGPRRFLTSLAQVWVGGVHVDWGSIYEGCGARRVTLPRYAFQRERYWVPPGSRVADLTSLGLCEAEHPMLGAAVDPADNGGAVFTGCLSLQTQPWLSDHAVMGTVLLPGMAFLEIALHAGAQLGCRTVSELTLEAPLILDERDAVQIQLVVGEPDELGARPLSIYSRSQTAATDRFAASQAWTRNGSGALLAPVEASPGDAGELAARGWPPEGSQPIELDRVYDRLAELGIDYGPAFQGLRAAWRKGREIYAEVSLPDDQHADAPLYGVHPALLDAALHGYAASLLEPADAGGRGGVLLPFSLSGVSLHATGVSSLRVHLSPGAGDTVSLLATDPSGVLVARMRSLAMRPMSKEALSKARGHIRDSLYRLDWVASPVDSLVVIDGWAALGSNSANALQTDEFGVERCELYEDLQSLGRALELGMAPPETVIVCCPPGPHADGSSLAGTDGSQDGNDAEALAAVAAGAGWADEERGPEAIVEAAHASVCETLEFVQAWLSDERFVASRLVLITRRAVAARSGEAVDLSVAPIWGLIRSAQAEHPERFVLVDLDREPVSLSLLGAALAGDEPQLAIRESTVFAARLVRVDSGSALRAPTGAPEWRMENTGTGTLEGLRLVASDQAPVPLEPGQVRVAVRAAGLNFRDVVTLSLIHI